MRIHLRSKTKFHLKTISPQGSLKQVFFRRASTATEGIPLYFKGAVRSYAGKDPFKPLWVRLSFGIIIIRRNFGREHDRNPFLGKGFLSKRLSRQSKSAENNSALYICLYLCHSSMLLSVAFAIICATSSPGALVARVTMTAPSIPTINPGTIS